MIISKYKLHIRHHFKILLIMSVSFLFKDYFFYSSTETTSLNLVLTNKCQKVTCNLTSRCGTWQMMPLRKVDR